MALVDIGGRTPGCVLNFSTSFYTNHNKYLCNFVSQITIKLLDYQSHWQRLEASDNVFALIVVAHLKTSETRHAPDQRLYWKFNLVKRLYTKGFQREDVLELFRFIDWLFALPAALEAQFQQQLIHCICIGISMFTESIGSKSG